MRAGLVRFSITDVLWPSAACSVVRESRSSSIRASMYSLNSMVTSSRSSYMSILSSSYIYRVSLLTAFSTISLIVLSSTYCLSRSSAFSVFPCGACCATSTVLASATFTSRNPSFFSMALFSLSKLFRLLECGWKVTYLPRICIDLCRCCL